MVHRYYFHVGPTVVGHYAEEVRRYIRFADGGALGGGMGALAGASCVADG